MVRVESRPLTSIEEQHILDDKARGPSRGEAGCIFAYSLVFLPPLGSLAAGNIAAALGLHEYRTAGATLVVLVFVAAVVLWHLRAWERTERMAHRASLERRLQEAFVERWTLAPARAWTIQCPQTRALLFEGSDGRLLAVASHLLEGLPKGTFPQRLEIEGLPVLERVLSLTVSDGVRPTEPPTLTLEELGLDHPLKKRRFVEIAPETLGEATRARLGGDRPGVPDRPPALPPDLRLISWDDGNALRRRLVADGARRRAALLKWAVPVVALVALPALARHAAAPRTGPLVSLAAFLFVAFAAASAAADYVSARSVVNLLSGNLDATPGAWRSEGRLVHLRGRVRTRETVESAVSSRRGAVARARHVFGWGILQAADFTLEADDGRLIEVETAHVWLVWSEPQERIVRLENAAARRLVPDAARGWPTYRWQFPLEQIVADGDVVDVLGLRGEGGASVRGSDRWPVLIWADGSEVQGF